jgi:hypothetical protein
MPDYSPEPGEELILAEEQSVVNKKGFMKETQGTLVLTNQRLIFVAANQEEEFVQSDLPRETAGIRFADVDDLDSIPKSPLNISIPLDEVDLETGTEGMIENPHLKIRWLDSGVEKKAEFIADLTDPGRKIDLKDWAKVIDSIKAGTIKIRYPSPASVPSRDTLEGKVFYIMGDMQDKGLIEIEEQTEESFKVELEPDEVQAACEKLVSLGLVDAVSDEGGDPFYRKRSPLGEDDLSS